MKIVKCENCKRETEIRSEAIIWVCKCGESWEVKECGLEKCK